VAYQHGCIPLSAEAIERAIELNGAAVKTNLAAFRWGRAAVALPDALEAELAPPAVDAKPASIPQVDEILDAVAVPDPVRQELGRFVTELVSYQDAAYARRYARAVARVAALERRGSADRRAPVAVAYARGLFKLMAYKDEYEVARLHLDSIEQARLRQEFGPGAGVQVLLHPPLLRALGMKRKLRLRRSAEPLFSVLYRARKLRGTRLDPFGYAGMRRLERELIDEYVGLVEHAAGKLTADNAQLVTRIAQLPEMVRGYEEIKLANVEQMRSRAAELQAQLERPSQPADALLPLVRA
jgi:indolepyruvate ferredoxin oxidoreductase